MRIDGQPRRLRSCRYRKTSALVTLPRGGDDAAGLGGTSCQASGFGVLGLGRALDDRPGSRVRGEPGSGQYVER